jgi:hypothetical protein
MEAQKEDGVDMYGSALYRALVREAVASWGRLSILTACFPIYHRSAALALGVSDVLATPLSCSPLEPWWISWPSYVIPQEYAVPAARQICNRQYALIAFTALILVVYTANMVLSLFRVLEKVSIAVKASHAPFQRRGLGV